jgi:hypothetical protein
MMILAQLVSSPGNTKSAGLHCAVIVHNSILELKKVVPVVDVFTGAELPVGLLSEAGRAFTRGDCELP